MTLKNRMKTIRARIAVTLIHTFLTLTVIIYAIFHTIMLGSIAEQEKKYVSEHVDRAVNAIRAEQTELSQTAADWAIWTDTYDFMANGNAQYVRDNLNADSLSNIRIDAMVFISAAGDMTYAGVLNKQTGELEQASDALKEYCGDPAVGNVGAYERRTGLILLPEDPMLFATCPILTSEGEGPLSGTLLVGRFIDEAEVAMLADTLKLDIAMEPVANADAGILALFGRDGAGARVGEISSDEIGGYALLRDVADKPALLLSLRMNRDMSGIGRRGITFAVVALAASCLLGSLLLLASLNRVVLSRLKALSADIKDIGDKRAFAGRLKPGKHGDELDVVTDEINLMLDSLEESREQVVEREKSLKKTNEDLQAEIVVRERAQSEIRHLAYHDHLTGLPNRVYLTEQLNHGIELARRIEKMLAVLFLDLDGFKMINDTMGHPAGDALLREVAKRLKRTVRKGDIIARLGGDEFIIMAENIESAEDVERVADKILRCFEEPFDVIGQECFITTSIGIAVHPTDGDDAETLIKNADIAMYKAKERGKNQFVLCTYGIKAKVLETVKLANRMFRALERKEFVLYYQPQVASGTNEILGVEALIRWNHPEMGLVLPGEFIGIAEQTGLIISIGEWVMRTACRQNKAWQDAGLAKIRMGVNLSIKQFQNHNIVQEVGDILRETGMAPEYLELEITESIAMKEKEYIVDALNAFRAMGVHISIDDFGTEYSSMSHLKQLPVDKIKIPMPFVQGIDVSAKDAAITKSIIVLAKSLGLSVLAEGVETKQQNDFLTSRMCDEIQGFFHYKPMPAEELEKLLREQVQG